MGKVKLSKEEYLDYISDGKVQLSTEGVFEKLKTFFNNAVSKLKNLFGVKDKNSEKFNESLDKKVTQAIKNKKVNSSNEFFFNNDTTKYYTKLVWAWKRGYGIPAVESKDGVFGSDNIGFYDYINKTCLVAIENCANSVIDDPTEEVLDEEMPYVYSTYWWIQDKDKEITEQYGFGYAKEPVTIKLFHHVSKESDQEKLNKYLELIDKTSKVTLNVAKTLKDKEKRKKYETYANTVGPALKKSLQYYMIDLFWNNTWKA